MVTTCAMTQVVRRRVGNKIAKKSKRRVPPVWNKRTGRVKFCGRTPFLPKDCCKHILQFMNPTMKERTDLKSLNRDWREAVEEDSKMYAMKFPRRDHQCLSHGVSIGSSDTGKLLYVLFLKMLDDWSNQCPGFQLKEPRLLDSQPCLRPTWYRDETNRLVSGNYFSDASMYGNTQRLPRETGPLCNDWWYSGSYEDVVIFARFVRPVRCLSENSDNWDIVYRSECTHIHCDNHMSLVHRQLCFRAHFTI